MKNLYLDLHVLQTVPPSCVNRDDTGTPKNAIYGGVPRARVSSQAWKHAMRNMFNELFAASQVGVRTKHLVKLVGLELKNLGYTGNVEKAVSEGLKRCGIKVDKEYKTDALFFMSHQQALKIAELIMNDEKDEKKYKAAIKDSPAIDIALFGRMVASDPSLNYDAASQIAHSISTHEVRTEYDYFTAVDDFSSDDNSGAGHLGTVEFNSATLYRYATINLKELKALIKNETPEAVQGFIKAFLLSMPTGKQNTFANRTVPDFAYITLRTDQPVNLCGAFEKPIISNKNGYVEKSIAALKEYVNQTYNMFVGPPALEFYIGGSQKGFGQEVSLKELLGLLETEVKSYCEES